MTPLRRLARTRRAWPLAPVAAVLLSGCASFYERHIPVLDGPSAKEYVTREGDVGRCVTGVVFPKTYEAKRPQFTLKFVTHPSLGDAAPDFEVSVQGSGNPTLQAVGAEVVQLGEEPGVKRYRLIAAGDGPFQLMVMVGERVLGSEVLSWRTEHCHSLMWGG